MAVQEARQVVPAQTALQPVELYQQEALVVLALRPAMVQQVALAAV
jgi:hypothetical protein